MKSKQFHLRLMRNWTNSSCCVFWLFFNVDFMLYIYTVPTCAAAAGRNTGVFCRNMRKRISCVAEPQIFCVCRTSMIFIWFRNKKNNPKILMMFFGEPPPRIARNQVFWDSLWCFCHKEWGDFYLYIVKKQSKAFGKLSRVLCDFWWGPGNKKNKNQTFTN